MIQKNSAYIYIIAGKLKFEETSLITDYIQLILRHEYQQGEEEVRHLPPSLEFWETTGI
jgi:hypothetical protein